jgi:hypothetical protein
VNSGNPLEYTRKIENFEIFQQVKNHSQLTKNEQKIQKLESAMQAVRLENTPSEKMMTDLNDELSSIYFRESGPQSIS